MEFSWKKLFLSFGIVVGPVVLAGVLLSTPMMDTYYRWVKEDPENTKSDWIDHRWLLLEAADTCYKTMRPEKAAFYYYEYMRLYPKDKRRRPYVLLQYGHALNEANENKKALVVYRMFREEYPGRTAECKEAKDGINHILYFKPH